ncbi:hypothetical protein [Myxococcus llanfairpwllgwyngyllgogerychwyrndrobwllllantysiliogogogochensis]|nr:hypothetical protein [Myxococcus llanfairpwllgwyngyllgogerychwyrndrobwllllantysiliogogogochensis]
MLAIAGVDHVFEGFTTDETWNGWEAPYFDRDEGLKIASVMTVLAYDSAQDAFILDLRKLEPQEDDYRPDIFPGQNTEEGWLYPVGSWCWCWIDVDDQSAA